jgi:hypothetical protein
MANGPGKQYSAQNILDQCLIAFGQGCGPILVTVEAVAAVRTAYQRRIEQYGGDWDADCLLVLEYARMVGRLAADKALADGSLQVEAGHVTSALSELEARIAAGGAWRPCPLC